MLEPNYHGSNVKEHSVYILELLLELTAVLFAAFRNEEKKDENKSSIVLLRRSQLENLNC